MLKNKLILSTLILPSIALAHAIPSDGQTLFNSLWHGFLHPLSGIDHIIMGLLVGFISQKVGTIWRFCFLVLFIAISLAGHSHLHLDEIIGFIISSSLLFFTGIKLNYLVKHVLFSAR